MSEDGSTAGAAGQRDRGPEASCLPAAGEEDQRGAGRGEKAGADHGEETQSLQGVHSSQGDDRYVR